MMNPELLEIIDRQKVDTPEDLEILLNAMREVIMIQNRRINELEFELKVSRSTPAYTWPTSTTPFYYNPHGTVKITSGTTAKDVSEELDRLSAEINTIAGDSSGKSNFRATDPRTWFGNK